MRVEELIVELLTMPPTATVVARIRYNVAENRVDGAESNPILALYEFRDAPVEGVVYNLGEVYLQLDENGEANALDDPKPA